MIEKIMRAVKSSNKKRGRNITIGAVVGMLLSCTSVMGADGYLWIRNNNGVIEFSTIDNNTGGDWRGNPYPDNSWNGKTYINNIILSGNNNGEDKWGGAIGYGVKLNVDFGKNFDFWNNGIISATGSSSVNGLYLSNSIMGDIVNTGIINVTASNDFGSGVYLLNSTMGNIANIGIITNSGSSFSSGFGVYLENSTMGDIVNTGIISGTGSSSVNGIYLKNSTMGDMENNGLTLNSSVSHGYGVKLSSNTTSNTTMKTLANNGIISGSSSSNSGAGYGIGLSSNTTSKTAMKTLANTGIISGTGSSSSGAGYGVNLSSNTTSNTTMKTLANTGIISGTDSSSSGAGYGVSLSSDLNLNLTSNTTVESMVNIGIISGISSSNSGSGFGVELSSGSSSNATVESIVNKGIIYGSTNAIYNNGGTISRVHNYGLLVNGDASEKVVDGLTNEVQNYGLIFNAVGDEYTIDDTFGNNFGKKSKEDGYTIINVKVGLTSDPPGKKIDNDEIKSLNLTDGELSYYDSNEASSTLQKENIDLNKKYILNGITDTLLVSTGDNRLNNSAINAYGNAVKFADAGGKLTLTGTIVNGGLKNPNDTEEPKRTYAIKGSSEADTLTLQGKTVINGNIDMGGGVDTLTIENGAQINGTLDGGTDSNKDTLNFGVISNVKTTSSNEEIRVLHNISGFENININSNVTFYENTIDNDGKIVDLKITGVENLTIGENGVLTLRIDSTKKDDLDTNKIIGHALYGAIPPTGTSLSLGTGTSISSTGGKLLLALNGAGNDSIISFGTTTLADTMVGAEDKSIEYQEDFTIDVTSFLHSVERVAGINNEVRIVAQSNIPLYEEIPNYKQLNKIYKGVISVNKLGNFVVNTHENLSTFLSYLNDIYAGNPYSYSSELSRKSAGMFRDIVTENQFKPNLNNWLIYGGLTHIDGGTKDTYFGKGYYTYDIGSSDIEADTKITGAYTLGEYGVSDTLTSGIIIGGNKLKSDLSNGSKVDGSALYLGTYAKKYIGNLKVTAGLGFQYGDYDADRMAVNRVASSIGESVTKYSSNYNDMTYDIYLNGRYSNPIGENLFLEPYGTLSYTYIKQDGANEGNKTLAIETDSKSFDYVVGKIGLDLKKVIPHSNGKSTLTAGVSYTKILDGAEEEYITGRFKGGADFDVLVAHKNEHSIGLNAKYALELESGILFDIKGTYSIERDSHNNSGKNKTKGEWIVGAGLGYKF